MKVEKPIISETKDYFKPKDYWDKKIEIVNRSIYREFQPRIPKRKKDCKKLTLL